MVTAGFEPAIPMYPTLAILLQANFSGVLPFHYVTGGATPPVEVVVQLWLEKMNNFLLLFYYTTQGIFCQFFFIKNLLYM